jgi:hypothetical protein
MHHRIQRGPYPSVGNHFHRAIALE